MHLFYMSNLLSMLISNSILYKVQESQKILKFTEMHPEYQKIH